MAMFVQFAVTVQPASIMVQRVVTAARASSGEVSERTIRTHAGKCFTHYFDKENSNFLIKILQFANADCGTSRKLASRYDFIYFR